MATPAARLDVLEAAETQLKDELNTFYLLWAGTLVFLMQAGFATLSAGAVRAVNVKNILMYTLIDATLGGIVWYLFGYGFAYDVDTCENISTCEYPGHQANPFIGAGPSNFALSGVDDSGSGYEWISWFFQYAFAAAAASITVGAITERTEVAAYLVVTAFMTGFIYPVAVHWVWDPAGFLSAGNAGATILGSIDFAGSGVVHITGGFAGLMGAIIVGPRMGRWTRPAEEFEAHSAPLLIIGTFLLWFGWFGFNPGSTLYLAGATSDMARVAVNTTLSPAAACIFGLLLRKYFPTALGGTGHWDLAHMCNSLLGGLVSITAGCSVVMPWAAIVIGLIGALVYHGANSLMLRVHVDDPLSAWAVHGACGVWGMLAVGFFAEQSYSYAPSPDSPYFVFPNNPAAGCFRGGNGMLLGSQLVVVIIEICWVCGTAGILFFSLNMLGVLRVKPEDEEAGLDHSKHGGVSFAGVSTSELGYEGSVTRNRVTKADIVEESVSVTRKGLDTTPEDVVADVTVDVPAVVIGGTEAV